MAETSLPLYVGVETVKQDLGVSRAKAYEIIKELNNSMKAEYPRAISLFPEKLIASGTKRLVSDPEANKR